MRALKNKGLSLISIDKYDEALYCFDKFLSLNLEDDGVMWGKGFSLEQFGNTKEALKYYNETLN